MKPPLRPKRKIFEARLLVESEGVKHGFFSRLGGVSDGFYESLNCGFGSEDLNTSVSENRRRVATALNVESRNLLTAYQTHSSNVIIANKPWQACNAPQADAIVTRRHQLAVGILTADCAPVLLVDAERNVVGAAHAGWKGALAGIIEATIVAMESIGARRNSISAAVGPCISQDRYQVGHEFRQKFLESSASNVCFFVPSRDEHLANHWQFDLAGFVVSRLEKQDIFAVENLDLCTYQESSHFYSYRRATHLGERDYGRNVSAIVLN